MTGRPARAAAPGKVFAAVISAGLHLLASSSAASASLEQGDRARAALETVRQLAPGVAVCEPEGDRLRYIGPSGAPLAACVEANAGLARLVITSLGGSVRATLEAAARIDAAGLEVEVVGVCFSSCANYIVPSARSVTVAPFSAIVLHGGPGEQRQQLRATLTEALRRAGAPEPALERLVDQELSKALALRAAHDAFAARHSVSQEWYDLTAFARADGGRSRAWAVAASPDFLAACVPNTAPAAFWFPRDDAMARELEQALALGPVRFAGLDLEAGETC